jgi:hypothetical protein
VLVVPILSLMLRLGSDYAGTFWFLGFVAGSIGSGSQSGYSIVVSLQPFSRPCVLIRGPTLNMERIFDLLIESLRTQRK